MDFALARQIAIENESKIVLLVLDGLGGLPHPDTGRTELEAAYTPNLDRLAGDSLCGFTVPVSLGVTPGSGPGHLALFGYDPLQYNIGRGVLEAVGIDFDLRAKDVAARGNFCAVDGRGRVSDRRAGRISSERCAELCGELRTIAVDGAELFVEPVKEHRFVLVLRGSGLSPEVADTDPQKEGEPPLPARALSPKARKTAQAAQAFVKEAQRRLADRSPANMVLLRGFAKRPNWPSLQEVFKLKAAAVAHYPMYRGLAKLVGMTALPTEPSLQESLVTLREHWGRFDFFFVHYKATDRAGEDGDFEGKVAAIEAVDAAIPSLLELAPDILMVAGDHSTPAVMAGHSWHPVPFLLRAKWARRDPCGAFKETELLKGSLGAFPASEALPLAMAHAGRFAKYGA